MSYRGQIVPIPFGNVGIETDMAQVQEPPFSLLESDAISCRYGAIEVERGSERWNQTVLPSGIASFIDYWPNDFQQRVIVACKDGRIYKFSDAYSSSEVAATGTASTTLIFGSQAHIVQAGSESTGSPRKIFIFSGNDQINVISGDGTTRNEISRPSADWANGNFPTFGIAYNGALWVMGCKSNPHTIYRSSTSDHEDFQTVGAVKLVTLFPGEGQSILTSFSWKTRLFFLKYPYGLYYVDDSDPTNILPFKLSSSVGASSAHSCIQLLDDLLVANSVGSVSSLKASLALGGAEQGDLFKGLKCTKFIQEHTNIGGTTDRWAVYYEDKKQALFTYRSPAGFKNDRIVTVDYHSGSPKVTFSSKDQPNCMAMVQDYKRVPRPFYGAEDGYLYQMDRSTLKVGGSGYTSSFKTGWIDFRFVDPRFQEMDKHFDFIGVTCEARGHWNLTCKVFIDNAYVETLTFAMDGGTRLDGGTYNNVGNTSTYINGTFVLDSSRLEGPGPVPPRIQPCHGMGKRISLLFSNGGSGQGFRISTVTFYLRPGGQVNR